MKHLYIRFLKMTYFDFFKLKYGATFLLFFCFAFVNGKFSKSNDSANNWLSEKPNPPCVAFANVISIGGAVTVPGSVYPSLTAAIFELAQCGIDKPIELSLNINYDSTSETFPITIPSILGSSATNTITIKPAAGISKTISGNNVNSIFKLNGTDHIVIDGSNVVNGTSKNLTIVNTNNVESIAVVWIASTNTDGATNITIKNTIISGFDGTVTSANILLSGSSPEIAAEVSNNGITITNNTLSKAQNGIYAFGNNTTPDQNWIISENMIGSMILADKGFRGITIQNANNFNITKNTISGISTNTTSTASGILLGLISTNGIIADNRINDVKNTLAPGYGSNGIHLNSSSTAANLTVYNNMIWDVASYGFAAVTEKDNGYGIAVTRGGGYKIYYNSVNMSTSQTRGFPAAINITNGVTSIGAIDLRNNIFANNQTQATGRRYSIYSGAARNVFSNINFNDYFSTDTLGYLGAPITTIANWRAATLSDLNSINIAPPFISPNDLHLQPCSLSLFPATPIAGITADIDGDSRSGIIPVMGADEFTAIAPPSIVSVLGASICDSGSVTISAVGSAGTAQYLWYDSPVDGTLLATTTTGSFTTPSISNTTTYYVQASSGSCSDGIRTPVIAAINPAPSTIVIVPTVFPLGATGCDLNYVRLDAVGGNVNEPISWSPITGLFTDSALTIPYVLNENVATVYASPENEQIYIATSSLNTCSKTTASLPIIKAKEIFTGLDPNNPTLWDRVGNWGLNVLPTSNKCLIIPEGKTVAVNVPDAVAKKITVENGGKLIIEAYQTLTLGDELINQSNPEDVVIQSDGNLIQINSSATMNVGDITAERLVTNLRNQTGVNVDYIYWSSPVKGQQTKGINGFSPGTPNANFFDYRESNDRFYQTNDPTFIPGKGYAVRSENGLGIAYNKTYVFTGELNNGDIEIPITRSINTGTENQVIHGFNLIGNPYPSNINIERLFEANTDLIHQSAWFWTNAVYTPYQQGSSYLGNNYAVYNGTGGNAATYSKAFPSATIQPNGIVKVGQGFIVQKKNLGTENLVFKNSYGPDQDMRVGSNGIFYYKNNAQKNRFTLQLISPDQLINSQLIGYLNAATDDFERDFDAQVSVLSSNLFYSALNGKRLLIQGKSNFRIQDKVTLGANFFENGTYTIALTNREGIFGNEQNIYLKDKQSNIITNLSQGSYTFNAVAGDNNARFEIIYEPETFLATDDVTKDEINVYNAGNELVIKASIKKITRLEIYDAAGRMIHQKSNNGKEIRFDAHQISSGIYILKIYQTENITTKKVIR